MGNYNLYDVYKNGKKVLSSVSTGEIESKLGIKKMTIYKYTSEQRKTREGYEIVHAKVDTTERKISEDWKREWNEARFRLNPSAKR